MWFQGYIPFCAGIDICSSGCQVIILFFFERMETNRSTLSDMSLFHQTVFVWESGFIIHHQHIGRGFVLAFLHLKIFCCSFAHVGILCCMLWFKFLPSLFGGFSCLVSLKFAENATFVGSTMGPGADADLQIERWSTLPLGHSQPAHLFYILYELAFHLLSHCWKLFHLCCHL